MLNTLFNYCEYYFILYLNGMYFLYSVNCNYTEQMEVWCFNATSAIFQLYRGSQFYWWRKPEYTEKTTDYLQVTDIMYQVHLVMSRIQTHNFKW